LVFREACIDHREPAQDVLESRRLAACALPPAYSLRRTAWHIPSPLWDEEGDSDSWRGWFLPGCLLGSADGRCGPIMCRLNREEAASLLRHVGTRNDYMESAFLARIEFGQRAFVPRTAVLERMCGSWS
jgi:hypothetical protein